MIIYNFLKYLILTIRYNSILRQIIRDENLLDGMTQLLGAEVKQDWLGRMYAVINPYIKDGQFDPTAQLFELGNDAPSEMSVEKYIMERLQAMQKFIHVNNMFDLLVYKIKRLDDYANYLFVMQVYPLADCMKWTKRFLWLILALIIIASAAIFFVIF